MTDESQELAALFSCNFLVLAVITYLDYIVHHVLYKYGLQFSFEWAKLYWIVLGLLNISISLYGMTVYWLKRNEDLRNRLTMVLIGVSNFLLSFNLDLLWFFFAGGLPSNDEVWTWFWLNGFMGIKWNTTCQIMFTVSIDVALILCWVAWLIYVNQRNR